MASRRPSFLPSLFRLPLELRQQIYAQLLPRENVSHPLPGVGITSISHRLPAAKLLNIHPQLTDEILDYFYAITTFKLIFSHAFNFFRVDPDLSRLERSPALRQIRKVEIVFFCDILLLNQYPSFGIAQFCKEIKKRAARACEVLSHAKKLRTVTVSWVDTTLTGGWEEKATILEPLRRLADERPEGRDITFKIGEINGPEDLDQGMFIKAMENVLGEGRKLDSALDGAADEDGEPSKLRMLAFDLRQDREIAREVAQMRSGGTNKICVVRKERMREVQVSETLV